MHGSQYDTFERDIAQQLGAENPQWHVWWGTGSHQFWAVPYWAARTPMVGAATPADLLTEMRRVEAELPPKPAGVVLIPLDPGQTISGPGGL